MKPFEATLTAFIDAQMIPAERLKQAIHYTLFPGGKRFRPQLIYGIGQLLEVPEADLHPIAIAVECLHTYSLVHDDLPAMDNDDLRRNRPTCHKAFDEATAILVGDALQGLAILALTPLQKACTLMQILLNAAGPSGMLSGQSLDLSELSSSRMMDISLLENIHYLKTTRLIQAAIEMTATLAPACTEKEKNALLAFGKHLGLAFQMQDDYLDAYDPQAIGKAKSSDQANEKQTFAFFYTQAALLGLIQETLIKTQQCLSVFNKRTETLIHILKNLTIYKSIESDPIENS